MKQFLEIVARNFKAAARNPNNPVVVEDEDLPGYFMNPRFRGATKQTKEILTEIMPIEEWEEIKEAAWDGFIIGGSYYRRDTV